MRTLERIRLGTNRTEQNRTEQNSHYMDHVVYLDSKAGEMLLLLSGRKKMIIRGAAGRKLPYGRVNPGDILYFLNNNAEALVKTRGYVSKVINSDRMSESESVAFVKNHQDKLLLTADQYKRWAGKRYVVLIELFNVEEVGPFAIDKCRFGNMDDWLPVGEIESVIIRNSKNSDNNE